MEVKTKLPQWLLDLIQEPYKSSDSITHLNQLPVLVRDADAFVNYWHWQASLLFHSYQREILDLNRQKQQFKKNKEVKSRIEKVTEAYEYNAKALAPVLRELAADEEMIQQKGMGALEISKDFENLFRDWAWETGEIESHLKAFLKSIPEIPKGSKILLIGGGSCRFAAELFKKWDSIQMLVTEINPLLLSVANELLTGHQLELFEVPPFPMQDENIVQKRLLKTDLRKNDQFQLVYQDFREETFVEGSFDCVITPWLIDVIDMPIHETIYKIAKLLKPSGQWLNFGPLFFQTNNRGRRYTVEDIERICSEIGFSKTSISKERLPQISSPINGFGRADEVFTTCFQRGENIISAQKLHENFGEAILPEYLHNVRKPVQFGLKLDEYIETHVLMFDILTLAKSNKSTIEITEDLANKYSVEVQRLLPVVQKLINDFYHLNIAPRS